MVDAPDTPQKTLQEQYVPLDKRPSQNLKADGFIKEFASILGIAALGALVGGIVGKALEAQKITLSKFASLGLKPHPLTMQEGALVGSKIGGLFALYQHWKKKEGTHIAVQNISGDLTTVLDPAQAEKEANKEAALLDDLKKLTSHSDAVTARRESAAPDAGRA